MIIMTTSYNYSDKKNNIVNVFLYFAEIPVPIQASWTLAFR